MKLARSATARPDSEPQAERAAGQRGLEIGFFQLGAGVGDGQGPPDFKAAGELEDIVETGEELEEYDPEEDDWRGADLED